MAGKRSAVKCPKCDVGMKRIYVKVDNRFKGLGNGCLRCGQILFANDEATERTPFDRAWQYLLKGLIDDGEYVPYVDPKKSKK